MKNIIVRIFTKPDNWKPENEIKTRNYNKVFEVYEKNGMPGIDWNPTGESFTPLNSFSGNTVYFEDIETGERYHNTITNQIELLKEDRT